jgi:hypothetical protein
MKNAVLFIVIFGLGALFYALVGSFIPSKTEQGDVLSREPMATTTDDGTEATSATSTLTEEQEPEPPVVITADGSLLDGPFPIVTSEAVETGATVRIIRSPEEVLLQFENWDEDYPPASHVYLSSDLNASEYFNLGPAKMSEEYLIYGIPLDANLDAYRYLLIYQTQLDETLFYARLK